MKKILVLLVVFVSVFGGPFTPKINAGRQWTKEEIDTLTYYHDLGCENYATILQAIHKLPSGKDRTIDEIQSMYQSIFLYRVKKRFTPDEDRTIKKYVSQYGGIKEALPYIKEDLKGRSPRSIRDRYKNYIFPSRKLEWSPEEDMLILKNQKEIGNKWAKIAQLLPTKTSTDIKNRWHHHLKKNAVNVFCIPSITNRSAGPASNTDLGQEKNGTDDSIFNELFNSDLIDDQFNFFYDNPF